MLSSAMAKCAPEPRAALEAETPCGWAPAHGVERTSPFAMRPGIGLTRGSGRAGVVVLLRRQPEWRRMRSRQAKRLGVVARCAYCAMLYLRTAGRAMRLCTYGPAVATKFRR